MYYLLAAAFFGLLGFSRYLGFIPLLIPAWYLLASLVTVIAYARDKRAALNDEWRVAEGTLQFMALVGGWPGATTAQQLFRHKTRKTSFQATFWFTVLANCSALFWLHTARGGTTLRSTIDMVEKLVMTGVEIPVLRQGLEVLLTY